MLELKEEFIDLLVDALLEEKGGEEKKEKKVKFGFFLRDKFIKSHTTFRPKKRLITEWDVKQHLERGGELVITGPAIITPLARDLIREKRIRIRWKG